MLNYNKYVRAESLKQAYELAQSKQNVILGGSIWLKMTNGNYNTVIDLCELELDTITELDEYFKIGAYVSLRDLECSTELNTFYNNAFYNALEHIEGVQFRNIATVGGSVVQKMGFSDICTLLLSMNAEVELYGAGRMSISEFYKRDRRIKDVLVAIWVPKVAANTAYSVMQNSKTDIAVLNCSITSYEDSFCVSVGARPCLARAITISKEELKEARDIDESVVLIMDRVRRNMAFSGNNRASKEYRETICSVLVERAFTQLK